VLVGEPPAAAESIIQLLLKESDMKGRTTIRRGGSITGMTGKTSRPIPLWTFEPAEPRTTLARLEAAYQISLDAIDRAEERTLQSTASGSFTVEGVKADVLSYALNNLVPGLHRARLAIKKAKAEAAERRSRLRVEGPDKTDIAAAFRRMEIRTLLRDMKRDDQARYFAGLGDNLPAEVASAILELPPEFSGVPKTRHDLIAASALQRQHGPEIAEIAELEDAIAAAESAVETGRDEVRLECGIQDQGKFDELAAPIEQKHAAPWLRRRRDASGDEQIRVVDLERGVERAATAEEVETGIFYRDYDTFREGRAA
jgi:hypothetical protein